MWTHVHPQTWAHTHAHENEEKQKGYQDIMGLRRQGYNLQQAINNLDSN